MLYPYRNANITSIQINKKTERCVIFQAELACWRHSLLSAAKIERGRYTCWHFTVEHVNGTAIAQYNYVEEFPSERNKCQNEKACGMEVWPCRVGGRLNVAVLRWRFPIADTIYCAIGFVAASVFGVIAAIRYNRERKEKREEPDDDDDSFYEEEIDFDERDSKSVTGSSTSMSENTTVPFSFRKRTPLWMEDRRRDANEINNPVQDILEYSP